MDGLNFVQTDCQVGHFASQQKSRLQSRLAKCRSSPSSSSMSSIGVKGSYAAGPISAAKHYHYGGESTMEGEDQREGNSGVQNMR